jgi:hypothetical protein
MGDIKMKKQEAMDIVELALDCDGLFDESTAEGLRFVFENVSGVVKFMSNLNNKSMIRDGLEVYVFA